MTLKSMFLMAWVLGVYIPILFAVAQTLTLETIKKSEIFEIATGGDPHWSPDGTKIACGSHSSAGIFVIKLNQK